jgi:hypothetical protein
MTRTVTPRRAYLLQKGTVKGLAILLLAFSATNWVQAQQTVGGVEAPHAITLHITQVVNIDEPEQGTLKSAWFDPAMQTTTRKFGTRLFASSDTARYTLSCIIHEGQTTSLGATIPTWDGQPIWFKPECTGTFHAGDGVVFYSLDNLIWLSMTDIHGRTLVHGPGWKPDYKIDKFWSFKADSGISAAAYGSAKGVNQVSWEKSYSIDSEELKEK